MLLDGVEAVVVLILRIPECERFGSPPRNVRLPQPSTKMRRLRTRRPRRRPELTAGHHEDSLNMASYGASAVCMSSYGMKDRFGVEVLYLGTPW